MKAALFLVLLCLPGIWLGSESASAQELVEQPEWSIGDWWEIRTEKARWRVTVIGRQGEQYVLAKTSEGEAAVDPNGKEKHIVAPNGVTLQIISPNGTVKESSDQREWVRFPLRPGGPSWSWIRHSVNIRGSSQQYFYECAGDRWETIEISGKKIRTLKISCTSKTRSGDDYTKWGHTAWYAPDAKRLVRLESNYVGGPAGEITAWNIQPHSLTK